MTRMETIWVSRQRRAGYIKAAADPSSEQSIFVADDQDLCLVSEETKAKQGKHQE